MFLFSLFSMLAQGLLFAPEQVHISFANDDTEMFVTWSSQLKNPNPILEYTKVKSESENVTTFANSVQAKCKEFKNLDNDDSDQRKILSYNAKMTDLVPGALYKYRVGSSIYGWSQVFLMEAKKNHSNDQVTRVLVYGDFGVDVKTKSTILSLTQEVSSLKYDAIIHNGDFAYDFCSDKGKTGDQFMNYIEPIASKLPYMVSQGNHEGKEIVLHYKHRFQMPGQSSNFYYSFNIGLVHFVSYSTEFIFEDKDDDQKAQMEFLKSDLSHLNRTRYPWLVVFGHRPLYCSPDNSDRDDFTNFLKRKNKDCDEDAEKVRNAFENIWHEYKVDIVIQSHVHSYERLATIYNNAAVKCEVENKNLCKNASAPVYIVTGAPGQKESRAPASETPLPFSKIQDDNWGYSRMTTFNHTHLLWEQVASSSQKVVDTLWLTK
jgi:3',5'-cyclic AMP phosphodiesterase CpdA